ncbi:hypothetical protein V8F33_005848 [Rhypophila sp. PSN 637]
MRLNLLPIFLLAQGILALPGTTSSSSATALPTAPTRKYPKNCGGHTPEPNPCPKGEICAPTQPPGTADFPGTCVFQPCGGKPSNGICPRGLVCVYSPTELRTDQPGRCLAAVLTCGEKGGMNRGSTKCAGGWTCLKDPRIDFEYQAEFKGPGICVPPQF